MKLEVGMYCRYKNFQNKVKIDKIYEIIKADETVIYDFILLERDGLLECDVIKSSFNIIDLIEVGDYINGQKVYYDEELNYLYVQCIDGDNNLYYESIMKQSFINNIKSVVTHEQMEQISYKLGK